MDEKIEVKEKKQKKEKKPCSCMGPSKEELAALKAVIKEAKVIVNKGEKLLNKLTPKKPEKKPKIEKEK